MLKYVMVGLLGLMLGFYAGFAVAGTAARFVDGGLTVELADTSDGMCAGSGWKNAVWTEREPARQIADEQKVYQGCWTERDGVIFMVFDDGTRYAVPRDTFKWVR